VSGDTENGQKPEPPLDLMRPALSLADKIVDRVPHQISPFISEEVSEQVVARVSAVIRQEIATHLLGLEHSAGRTGRTLAIICALAALALLVGASLYCGFNGRPDLAGIFPAFGVLFAVGVFNQWHWFE